MNKTCSVVLLALACGICQPAVVQAADPVPKPAPGKSALKRPVAKKPTAAKPGGKVAVQVAPAELAMPKVVMSEAHAKTCLVKVGDPMPDVGLQDLAGKRQPLPGVLGNRFTVVLFWQTDNPYAIEELTDMGPDIRTPFADSGVEVVAINEHDTLDVVAALVKQLAIKFPVLLDPDGKTLAKVASRRLPRTYLLDKDGKILWFDMEYSASTRRDLRDALRVVLNTQS